MPQTKRTWDVLTDDQRRTAIHDIMSFYLTERGEEIGVIAAGELLDMFLQNIGPHVHNNAIDQAKSFLKTQMETVTLDMEVNLKK